MLRALLFVGFAFISHIVFLKLTQICVVTLPKGVLVTRDELAKLRVDASKGTLRKESGKLKPLRHDIARMLTRINEMKKEK